MLSFIDERAKLVTPLARDLELLVDEPLEQVGDGRRHDFHAALRASDVVP